MAMRWRPALTKTSPSRQQSAVLSEPAFLRALCLERKRAERSQRPFVLTLIEDPHAAGDRHPELVATTAAVLPVSIRATDIAGWHTENRVLGVVFSEVGMADKESVLAALRARITGALRSTLKPEQLDRLEIALHYFPETGNDGGQEAPPGTPLYPDLTERDEARRVSRVLKRVLDVVGSVIGLVLFSPLFLAIAVAIKSSSPGPVFFRQRRIGQHGVPFTFLKFRSMHASNDPQPHRDFVTGFIAGHTPASAGNANGRVVYKITRDPRVTRVGRLLRKTSFDELPQLLNVLKGEMSLVGPRPPIPYELEAYQTWHRRRFLEAQPGITGLWQVSGWTRLRFDDMVRLDLRYAEHWSIWLDVKILLRTPRVVLSGEGAY
jgi:lipopolysaccharide/colanic/teichoic acid biosynthesis glycosyltransferase